MKTAKTGGSFAGACTALSVLAGLVALPAHATLLALDDINYAYTAANTELHSKTGGGSSGFSAAWSANNTSVDVKSPSLSWFDAGTSQTVSGNNASPGPLDTGGPTIGTGGSIEMLNVNNSNRGTRNLTAITSSSLFVSILMSAKTGSVIDNSDQAFFWFGNAAGSGGAGNTAMRFGFSGQTTGNEFGVDLSNGTTFTSQRVASNVSGTAAQVTAGDTYLLVAKLSKDIQTGVADPYDKVEFWVNPTLTAATFTSPSGANYTSINLALSSGTLTSINRVGFGGLALDSGDITLFDRIRIGTTLDDILPISTGGGGGLPGVPEPGTFAAAGAAILAGAGWFVRRRYTALVVR